MNTPSGEVKIIIITVDTERLLVRHPDRLTFQLRFSNRKCSPDRMEALMGVIEAVISQTSRISKGETRGKIRTWPVALFSFHELRDALWDAILPFSFLLENILCKIGKVELCVFIAICNFFFLFIIFVFFLFLGLAVCPLYDSRRSSTS